MSDASETRASLLLARYANMRARLWANIEPRTELRDAEKKLLLEDEYARAVVELLHPELMSQPEWRNVDAVLNVAATGKHREGRTPE